MNKVFLHNIAYIVKDRINSNEIHLSQYVDTDSIISNKNGKNKSLSLPVNTSLFKFKKNDRACEKKSVNSANLSFL